MPPRKRRSYTAEYKVEAAHRVIDSGRTISEVARELGIDAGMFVSGQRRTTQDRRGRGPRGQTPGGRRTGRVAAPARAGGRAGEGQRVPDKASAHCAAMQKNRPGSL
ncbi:transposase [Amycolatopsis ultiminotia]|uniref:transposase n=1 Tax=Amycolatopsis ultiminotia TaxID=543629 RepID=UPI003CD0BC1A